MGNGQTTVSLTCRGCGAGQDFSLPVDVGPPPSFLCRVCTAGKSMLDGVDYSEIGKTRLARKLAWQREADKQREAQRQGSKSEDDGYDVYLRKKDRDCKFRRRNGFTLTAWHARVDVLGWRCSFCRCQLTRLTVLRWSTDGSKRLGSQVPICRPCQCKRVGTSVGDRCPTIVVSRGARAAVERPGRPPRRSSSAAKSHAEKGKCC
jgi:hypothetical protein